MVGSGPRWVAKARREVELGHARTVVARRPGPTRVTGHEHIAGRAAVYFLTGRLRFGDGGQSATFPSALAVWGARPALLALLDKALPGAWRAG